MRWHLVAGALVLAAVIGWVATQGGSLPGGNSEPLSTPELLRNELLAGEVLVAEFTPPALEEPVFRFTSVEGTGWVWEWLGNYDAGRSVLAGTGDDMFLVVDGACYFRMEGVTVPLIPWLTLDFLPVGPPLRNDVGNLEFDIEVPGETPVRVEEDLSGVAGGVVSARTLGTARGALYGTYAIRAATQGEEADLRGLLEAARPSAFGMLSLTTRPLWPVDKPALNDRLLVIPADCSERHFALDGWRHGPVLGWDRFLWVDEPDERVRRLRLRRDGDVLLGDAIDLGETGLEYQDDYLVDRIRGRSAAPVEIEKWMMYALDLGGSQFMIYFVNDWEPQAESLPAGLR